MMNLADVLVTSEAEFCRAVLARREQQGWGRQRAAQAREIATRWPDAQRKVMGAAEEALAGSFVLPGTGGKPFFVGDPPKWNDVLVEPFDAEYLWLLNRQSHWITLLKAYCFTGEGRYAVKVVTEMEDWIATCPRPGLDNRQNFCDVVPWRALETGIRMYHSWPWIAEVLLGTEHLSPAAFGRYAVCLYEHAEALATVSPQLWPNADHNHYLMEMLGLFAVATRYPEFKNATRWSDFAAEQLERCAAAQITADGGQVEGCPHYHNVCVDLFYIAGCIGQEAGVAFSPRMREHVEKSVVYAAESIRPTGESVGWGDSDIDAHGIRSMIQAEVMFPDHGWLGVADRLAGAESVAGAIKEMVWRIPDAQGQLAKLGARGEPVPPRLYLCRGTDQAMMRTGWERADLSVFFGCHTPVNNGHAHQDPGAFDFTALGRPILVDPGRFTYREGADRRRYKSATAHNTLTVNRQEPFAYVSSWEYGPMQEGRIAWAHDSGRVLAAEAIQHNFAPAVHRRCVAIVDGRIFVVLDEVAGLPAGATVQRYFHFDSAEVAWDAAALCAQSMHGDVRAALWSSPGGSGEALEGWISPRIDVEYPSRRLLLEDSAGAAGTRLYAAVVVPWREAEKQPRVSDVMIAHESGANVCRFTLDGKSFQLTWREGGVGLAAVERAG